MENPRPQGCRFLAPGSADMNEPLVDAKVQWNAERSEKRPSQADDGSPAVTPEIRRLALSFRILVKSDHAGHSLTVFRNIGVIPLQHDSAVYRYEFLLRYDECLPAGNDVAERPGRRPEKIYEHVVAIFSKPPESAQGSHSDHFGGAYESYDRHAENNPWLVARKTTAKSFEGMQNKIDHENLHSLPFQQGVKTIVYEILQICFAFVLKNPHANLIFLKVCQRTVFLLKLTTVEFGQKKNDRLPENGAWFDHSVGQSLFSQDYAQLGVFRDFFQDVQLAHPH